ncbi:hydantoinase B/oxoprolinase family protein [Burkholderia ubonensis]|uniref:Hydantoin utilization protein B n=1 Tax=Burkholderia ubonensis TaxID=101571 RepID=A0AAW3MJP9_9BURK|nr:hydantoinase B/oxoprolinase family protein [Burkholderia ubonensis]KVD30161.1 hydantoin utilization protein B [Burkholderia ubonensis]KVN73717.1 hydantoin utilization protein B [Burkholderia ubonensis]KVP87617.1 hydantoin utilization protein B [Burkholderia ubonensis]KVT84416.1 hydantoin utilization protein B [Burkholderia ubonensis]KVX22573.1 hydantoin utilization protein B [Burkholderia ubonensis]
MTFNRSVLQIFANYCVAAAESMAHTLMRTAHSAFVKETEDFSCTIMTPEGLTFASPKTLGATWYPGLDFGAVIDAIDHYEPGDIGMTNDAYSGYVATHTPDVMMWKPVFYNGEIVCYVGGHIHNTDMGGAVPASLSRTLTEIYQEGIRWAPTKIMRAGVLDETLLDHMAINVRAAEQNRGDLKAQIAMLMTGERRVLEIIERFGIDDFKAGMHAMIDYSEEQARAIVAGMPDGEYFFAEYADEDSVNGKPLRVALNLKVEGESLVLDFTGSDPQLNSSLNMPTGGKERHVLALVGLNYVLYSLHPDLLLNAGMLKVARCILPEGTIMNCVPPAAVGMRSLTCKVAQNVTFGAFSMVCPDRLPACPAGGMSILNVRTVDSDGRTVIAAIGPVGGGAGGMINGDGSDASGANVAFLRNTPVEINEAEVPIRILKYGMVPGSAGAGRYRGGLGTVMEFRVFSPGTLVTARNRDRSRFASWGVLGGKAGSTSRFTRNPGTEHEENLGVTDLVVCGPGDVIRLEGCGGGGYGNPYERDPQMVATDVKRGYMSEADALTLYGVVLHAGEVDVDATSAQRTKLAANAPQTPTPHFDYGAARTAYEARWTRERYAVLTDILAGVPVVWRHFLKHKIFDAFDAWEADGRLQAGGQAVIDIFREIAGKYPQLLEAQRAA